MSGIEIFISIITGIIMGLFHVFVSFLVEKNPEFIAGYNTLEESLRKPVIDFLRKGLKITGIVIIAGCSVSAVFKWSIGILSFLILPHVIMVIMILIKGKRTGNKKR